LPSHPSVHPSRGLLLISPSSPGILSFILVPSYPTCPGNEA
jgi:hypothetical protein